MAPLKYSDFCKPAEDLLRDDYCFDKKFKLKSKAKNGFELTSEGTLKGDSVSAKLTGKIAVTPSITLNKVGVTNNGRMFADATYANVVDGLSLSTVVEDGAKAPQVGEFSVKYMHRLAALNVKVDTVNGPTVKTNLSSNYEKVHFGGEVKYNTGLDGQSKADLKDYNVGVAFQDNDLLVALTSRNKLSECTLGVHHKVSKDAQVGVIYSHGASKSLDFAGSLQVDKTTKFQAKVSSAGLFSANAHQTLSNNVKLIASAQVDAKNLAADSHKFGLQFILS